MTTSDGAPAALPTARRTAGLRTLSRPGGGFAMVALDQRVSLENMFADAGLASTGPALDRFRSAAAGVLAPLSSAILLDPGYVSRAGSDRPWTGAGGLIVAADDLEQEAGQPASGSRLDRSAADVATAHGATALKLLVVWEAGSGLVHDDELGRLVEDFVRLAHERSMLAIVEGIVRPGAASDGERATADEYLRAAVALSGGADLYKAELPVNGGDDPADVERLGRELTAAIACPWVVLSTGMPPHRFRDLLAASCRGGASGFLAGRAIWRSAIGASDPHAHLVEEAAPRLRELSAVVDATARPWEESTLLAATIPA